MAVAVFAALLMGRSCGSEIEFDVADRAVDAQLHAGPALGGQLAGVAWRTAPARSGRVHVWQMPMRQP